MFDAGALLFSIKTAGAQLAQQDLRQTEQAFDRTGKAADTATKQVDGQGNATDQTAKKSRAAKAPLDEQARSTEKVGDESRKAAPKQQEQAKASERQAETAGRMSVALLAAGVAVSALVGLSVAKYAEFDQAMSNVAAATMASRQEQEQLADAALEAGADTAYSAREAAGAQEELAKAGLTTAQIVSGGLNGSLALAAAGQLEVARSAEIMATTLTQFRLPAEQAAKVSDVLAAGAGKAQGSVDDLALALSYVGPLAGSVGFSIEETAGTIAYFATQGIIGEKAGTSLRGVLAALQAPSAAADKEMKKYNISMFDANGNMLSLSGIAEQLRTRLGGLTEQERLAALGRIFGNESLNAATLLYEGGAEAVEKWTAQVDDSGFAAEQAAMRQDNLAGDVEKLGGAFDTALIKTGSGANDVLRDGVQIVTGLVDAYGELPDGVQATALVLGVATGAMLLFSGGALGAISRFAELKTTLEGANLTLGRTALIAGGVGLALTGVLVVVSGLAQRQAEARAAAESYADAIALGGEAAVEAARKVAVAQLQADPDFWDRLFGSTSQVESAFDSAEKLGLGLDTVTEAWLGNEVAAKKVNAQIDRFREGGPAAEERASELGVSLVDVTNAASNLDQAMQQGNATVAAGEELLRQQSEAATGSAEKSQTAATAYLEAAGGADELNSQLSELIDQIMEANGIGQDAISANIDYKNALAEVDEVIRKATEGVDENKDGVADYSLTLDQATQAGRDNLEMLNGMAASSQEAADKQFAVDRNTANYKATLEAGRQALIDRATQLGMNADEAGALADEIYRIPSETEWKVIAETADARARLDSLLADYSNKTISVQTLIKNIDRDVMPKANGGRVEFYANGGRSENHIAQFARAGTWRVWAEPETEGEWYIPRAMSKRPRSTAVLADAADDFGYELRPKGVQRFADGGYFGPGDASSSAPATVDVDINVIGHEADPYVIGRVVANETQRRLVSLGIPIR